MKRVIEFRGRRIDTNEWVYGDLEIRRASGRTFIHTYNEDGTYNKQYEVDPESVGQYTGLKDKNGRKIYEYDVLRLHDVGTYCVRYNSERCQFELRYRAKRIGDNGYADKLWELNKDRYEVIGNIFENSELIKEG